MKRADLLAEWLGFFRDALRFGADGIHAGEIADVLVFGRPGGAQFELRAKVKPDAEIR